MRYKSSRTHQARWRQHTVYTKDADICGTHKQPDNPAAHTGTGSAVLSDS